MYIRGGFRRGGPGCSGTHLSQSPRRAHAREQVSLDQISLLHNDHTHLYTYSKTTQEVMSCLCHNTD